MDLKLQDRMLVVIDLETLGTNRDSVVMALGICIGDVYDHIVYREEFIFPLVDQIKNSEINFIDKSTINWWNNTNKALFRDYLNKCLSTTTSIRNVLKDITQQIKNHTVVNNGLIVANSPTFDLIILKRLYKDNNVIWPFSYKQEFDVRTMNHLFFDDEKVININKHNALSDAVYEYRVLVKQINILMEMKK